MKRFLLHKSRSWAAIFKKWENIGQMLLKLSGQITQNQANKFFGTIRSEVRSPRPEWLFSEGHPKGQIDWAYLLRMADSF